MENEPKHKVDLYMTILLVLVSALIFGVLGFAYGQQISKESAALESSTASVNYPSESTVTTSATVSATTSASTTVSTTSTADWKTYANSEYGFSFKYPKDWVETLTDEPADTNLAFKVTLQSPTATAQGQGSKNNIYLAIFNGDSSPLADWLTNHYKKADTELENYTVGKQITLGQINGYLSDTGCCGANNIAYVVKKNSLIYALGSTYAEAEKTISEIYQTFQFTK